jgi:Xaa-Pro dipeptidase
MALDVAAAQKRLRDSGLDGWLLYDFHGSNPIASSLLGLANGAHMSTRRWYYMIPADGPAIGLVHAIERHNLDHVPGDKIIYAGRQQLAVGLARLLEGRKLVAMEYSPACAIPYLSRVDAGTAESVRAHGVEIVSSGDLVQTFAALWTDAQLATHRAASAALYRIKDRAFDVASRAVRAGGALSEFELQQQMLGWFADEGLITDSGPVVAVGSDAGDPHYLPTVERAKPIVADEVLLLDLWGKLASPGAVFADITWVGVTARHPAPEVSAAFSAVAGAR